MIKNITGLPHMHLRFLLFVENKFWMVRDNVIYQNRYINALYRKTKKIAGAVGRVQFVVFEKIYKCLFIPNFTRKIMWLRIIIYMKKYQIAYHNYAEAKNAHYYCLMFIIIVNKQFKELNLNQSEHESI